MEKKYVSVDIESSGTTPGKYSMLSLGACVVGEAEKQFYRELKPISKIFMPGAMAVACLGLKCLEAVKHKAEYDPKCVLFKPEMVLDLMEQECEEPGKAMNDFRSWVLEVTKGYRPVIAARPTIYDGMFVAWYFDNFCDYENPFGHSGEDINSMYRGLMRDTKTNIDAIKLEPGVKHTHNALEDAVEQALKFEHVLLMMKKSGEHLKPLL